MSSYLPENAWSLDLSTKPDFDQAVGRIYAWYTGAVIDRVPVRFFAHNSFKEHRAGARSWETLKDRWFDHQYIVDEFIDDLDRQSFLGETFPFYFPNLGPNVYAAYYGSRLEYGEDTSWAEPIIKNWGDVEKIEFCKNEEYQKILELTHYALERCPGKFMVGYTDLHPGMDCLAAWRDTQELLIDLYDEPDEVKRAAVKAGTDFHQIFHDYDNLLKAHKQLSVTWMGIPSFGTMHIPSCDFSAMISPDQFIEFCLPGILAEMKGMTHNIFHMDGRGVARHLDTLLQIKELDAIQWVQGVNEDKDIAQWIPMIKKIQNHGKSIVLGIERHEIALLMNELKPEGILLCVPANSKDEQEYILKQVSTWS